jgi:hypothetical protein
LGSQSVLGQYPELIYNTDDSKSLEKIK